MTADARWKQSDPRTCGAASLMVALASFGRLIPSAEREMEIWRYANDGSSALPGSFPGRLALYALSLGCTVALVEDRPKLEAIVDASGRRDGFDPGRALREHDAHVSEAERQGVVVTRTSMTPKEVADLATRASVLMLVSTGADISGLHWVLLRQLDGASRRCTVMDPALGRDFSGPIDLFLHHFSVVHPFAGVSVALSQSD